MPDVLEFTIFGEAASKANSRELVTRTKITDGGKKVKVPMVIKSEKAREFEANALRQIPPKCRVRLQGPVFVRLTMFYASERPDLDEAVVLDVLQDRYAKVPNTTKKALVQNGCYRNDRQVRGKLVLHRIDRINPRIEVRIRPMTMQQNEFEFEDDDETRNDAPCAF
jgi:Holliday junction resolvase RusA-like endonuclease